MGSKASTAPLSVIKECTFRNSGQQLDGFHFDQCTFVDCVLTYSGGQPPVLTGNQFIRCEWRLSGAAHNTIQFLIGLQQGGVSQIVDDLFSAIKSAGTQGGAP
jgi:hypothetical protein